LNSADRSRRYAERKLGGIEVPAAPTKFRLRRRELDSEFTCFAWETPLDPTFEISCYIFEDCSANSLIFKGTEAKNAKADSIIKAEIVNDSNLMFDHAPKQCSKVGSSSHQEFPASSLPISN
jgi:hypothetical protein